MHGRRGNGLHAFHPGISLGMGRAGAASHAQMLGENR
jgi:hypothetical protein